LKKDGVDEMKQILSRGILVVVILASSGFASGNIVSDTGCKITTPFTYNADADGIRHVYHWELITYSKNHLMFKITQQDQYNNYDGKGWFNDNRKYFGYGKHVYLTDYIKTSSHKMTIKERIYFNTHIISSSKSKLTTTKTAHYIYKHTKASTLKYIIRNIGDKDWHL